METVAVQYVGSHEEVHVPAAGVTALRGGDPVEVPADIAGVEPTWRPRRPGDDLAWLQSREVPTGDLDADGRPVLAVEVYDLGSGLLAQTDAWVRVQSVEV